jgi:hypothetical protein
VVVLPHTPTYQRTDQYVIMLVYEKSFFEQTRYVFYSAKQPGYVDVLSIRHVDAMMQGTCLLRKLLVLWLTDGYSSRGAEERKLA